MKMIFQPIKKIENVYIYIYTHYTIIQLCFWVKLVSRSPTKCTLNLKSKELMNKFSKVEATMISFNSVQNLLKGKYSTRNHKTTFLIKTKFFVGFIQHHLEKWVTKKPSWYHKSLAFFSHIQSHTPSRRWAPSAARFYLRRWWRILRSPLSVRLG